MKQPPGTIYHNMIQLQWCLIKFECFNANRITTTMLEIHSLTIQFIDLSKHFKILRSVAKFPSSSLVNNFCLTFAGIKHMDTMLSMTDQILILEKDEKIISLHPCWYAIVSMNQAGTGPILVALGPIQSRTLWHVCRNNITITTVNSMRILKNCREIMQLKWRWRGNVLIHWDLNKMADISQITIKMHFPMKNLNFNQYISFNFVPDAKGLKFWTSECKPLSEAVLTKIYEIILS